MAFDPSGGRFYWANYGNREFEANALGGTALLSGTAQRHQPRPPLPSMDPQDPVVLKSPTGTDRAVDNPEREQRSACSQGSWSGTTQGLLCIMEHRPATPISGC